MEKVQTGKPVTSDFLVALEELKAFVELEKVPQYLTVDGNSRPLEMFSKQSVEDFRTTYRQRNAVVERREQMRLLGSLFV